MEIQANLRAKPFLKWVGGKRQLMDKITDFLPGNYNRYFEPFLGGGSVFMEVIQNDPYHQFIISDSNKELINVYKSLKINASRIINGLKNMKANYTGFEKEFYYQVRKSEPKNQFNQAIRFMFLNRTCWNGVYRVNASGKFNVPMGDYKNPRIVDEDNIRNVSELLRKKSVKILHQDFDKILTMVKKGDFIYLDPPYVPISETSKFVSYTVNGFNQKDFERFVEFCNKLNKKKCFVLISNSYSDFIRKEFKSPVWKRYKIKANRSINCVGINRTNHRELLIKNY